MDKSKERMLDLLTDEILFGLDDNERKELSELEKLFPDLRNDNSLELTAGAIGLSNLEFEPMPEHLHNKILAQSNVFFSAKDSKTDLPENNFVAESIQKTFEFQPKRPFFQWLGWVFAGLAFIAFGVTFWANLQKPPVREVYVDRTPKTPTVSEQYEKLLTSAKELKKTNWVNPKDDKQILGEIIWSDSEQKGFMKFKGLSANDVGKESYQLWIFDETQDEKTPIDGGVFDVNSNGEVLIPIDAKLKVKNPKMFAITVEKSGGVVVSKREKIAAIAKISA